MKKIKSISKKDAMKKMNEELKHILQTTDYSTYDIEIIFDATKRVAIIPKPVMALCMINEEVREWSITELNKHPGFSVIIK